MSELASGCGAQIVPETTPRGTFTVRVVFNDGDKAAVSRPNVDTSSLETSDLASTKRNEMVSPLSPSSVVTEEEDEEEVGAMESRFEGEGQGERSLSYSPTFEPEEDNKEGQQEDESNEADKAEVERPKVINGLGIEMPDTTALSAADEWKTRQLMKLLMEDPAAGAEEFYVMDREKQQWIEAKGGISKLGKEEAGNSKGAFVASPLVTMQQKEIARFKHTGSVHGQMREFSPVWDPKVNTMRRDAGERRQRLSKALSDGAMKGQIKGDALDSSQYMSEADAWQVKFESEADRIHELEQELVALKTHETGKPWSRDMPPPKVKTDVPESKLGGEEPFFTNQQSPNKNQDLIVEVAPLEQPPHPLARKGGVPQLVKPVTTPGKPPLRGALSLGPSKKKGSENQVPVPANRLGQVVRQALANGFKANDNGDWEQALVEFRTVLDADPTNAAAFYGTGYARYLEGDHAGSTEAYSMALQLDPEPTAKKISRPRSKEPQFAKHKVNKGKKKAMGSGR